MNEKKISFIICTNDELYFDECMVYLSELEVPEGYEVDLIKVTGAKSMAAGCNEGMAKSDAKYKVYMHQDVYLTNKHFLADILKVFQSDDTIGMLGLVGTPYMLQTGVMWEGIRYGGFYRLEEMVESDVIKRFYPIYSGYMEVEAVDGLLMATQHDLPWREDIFKRWDFYDVSQSFEFLRAGYKVVVPGQRELWYIHDCGAINLENYNGERKLFLRMYADYMEQRKENGEQEYLQMVMEVIKKGYHGEETEKQKLLDQLKDLIKECKEKKNGTKV